MGATKATVIGDAARKKIADVVKILKGLSQRELDAFRNDYDDYACTECNTIFGKGDPEDHECEKYICVDCGLRYKKPGKVDEHECDAFPEDGDDGDLEDEGDEDEEEGDDDGD